MPHGGKRPGAGAPRGNFNGLKHGRSSRQFRQLLDALVQVPEIRDLLLQYNRHQQRKKDRARRVARSLFTQLLHQVPEQPTPELNQVIDQLRKAAGPSPASLTPSKK